MELFSHFTLSFFLYKKIQFAVILLSYFSVPLRVYTSDMYHMSDVFVHLSIFQLTSSEKNPK